MTGNAARNLDLHVCPVASPTPHVGGPIRPVLPCGVKAEGQWPARLGDFAVCSGPADMLIEGATTVLVNGLPWCATGHHALHGGLIATGAPTVLIGGPSFAPPATFILQGDSDFKNKTIRDLFMLSTTHIGSMLIARLVASQMRITFQRETVENSYCSPNSLLGARLGSPVGSTILYNPDIAVWEFGTAGQYIRVSPQVVLAHELVHAMHFAEGRPHAGTDPTPPASEPAIEEEEAATIGTGSHGDEAISENSLRVELGRPRRDNHLGVPAERTTENFRPGAY